MKKIARKNDKYREDYFKAKKDTSDLFNKFKSDSQKEHEEWTNQSLEKARHDLDELLNNLNN